MTKRLLSFFNTYFFALLLLPFMAAFIPVSGSAQSAGDVAFVGFNGDREDEIAIVSFINLTAGTNIYFRDEEWDESITSFGSGEGEITYTVPSGGISAGDVVIINPTTEAASDGGTVNETNSYNFGVSGDELYAYLGSDKDTPTTFLFAITTKSSWGANEIPSDLTDGITALPNIGGSANQDNGEYSGTRLGTISQLKSLIQYVSNEWITTNGIGDQDIEFDQTSFTLVDPPTVAFTTETFSVDENGTSIDLTVELVEASSTAVDVDVVFLSGSSTASAGDIDSYTTQTASFGSGAASGATETVTITLIDDTNFEGTERAVFRLQNNTAGSIVSPDVLTLTINDDDAPDIVINEILYDPNGDADGNGILDISDDEFIEFVNNESFDIDISGWTVYDDPILDLRHTFPSGTVIPANGALVLFGDDTVNPVGGFGGAVVQSSNESATLSLNNGGDTITLQDAEGNTVVSETYSGTQSDESITRDPDITGSFTDHSGATGSSTDFSPGTKIDGTAFGSATYAIGIRGSEGWRMISSPTSSTTFNDLFADIWTQGATGSDDPGGGDTQLSWNETTGTFTAPASMSDPMTPGKGYIVYVFEDDEFSTPGIQGGFPKVVSTDKAENNNFSIGITATDTDGGGISTDEQSTEGFNLLGNPFGTDLSVTALLDALEAADASASANIQVWDHDGGSGQGAYVELNDGDFLAPFQAFWVQYTTEITAASNTEVTFNRSNLAGNSGAEFFKQTNNTRFSFNLSVHDEQFFDPFYIEFSDEGTVEFDRYDASKLFSLNPDAIDLYGILGSNILLKNSLPERPEEIIEIPLAFDAPNRNELTFRWDGLEEIPQYWDVTLIDRTLGRELDLRRDEEYTFAYQQQVQNKSFGEEETLYKATPTENGDIRFLLRINPGQVDNSGNQNAPSSNQLNPNYPNPFNPTTTISYSLTQDTQVKISVWNIVGQKVATLVDGVVEAGTHTELWNASDMPSGIYIAQMEVGGNVYIRKMTLIK